MKISPPTPVVRTLLAFLCILSMASAAVHGGQAKSPEHWLSQLKSDSGPARVEATRQLVGLLDEAPRESQRAIVAGLVNALADRSPLVRREVAYGLASLKTATKEVAAALEKAAKDPEPEVRLGVHVALWRLNERREYLTPVLDAVKDSSPAVRRAAVFPLAFHVKNKDAVAALVSLLKDPDKEVQRETLSAMRMLCGYLKGDARDAVPTLTALLTAEDFDLRWDALGSLGGIGPDAKAAVPEVLEMLKDPEPRVRGSAAWALGSIQGEVKTIVPALTGALADPKSPVRMEAAYALGRIGPPARSAGPALEKAAMDKATIARVAARLALWRTQGDEKHWRQALAEAADDKNSAALVNSASWLASLGATGVPVLTEILKHPQAKDRETAAFFLGQIHPPTPQAIHALTRALEDPDPAVRQAAADSLRAIDPKE